MSRLPVTMTLQDGYEELTEVAESKGRTSDKTAATSNLSPISSLHSPTHYVALCIGTGRQDRRHMEAIWKCFVGNTVFGLGFEIWKGLDICK